ncbi:Hypothetical predicted protein, partial [Marmota monax]
MKSRKTEILIRRNHDMYNVNYVRVYPHHSNVEGLLYVIYIKLILAPFKFQCPLIWQNKWEGPEDPLQYLRGLVARALAIQNWVDKAEKQILLSDTLDLSELFHPDTFLNALRQETARAMGHSVDSLKFVASWKGRLQEAKLQIK